MLFRKRSKDINQWITSKEKAALLVTGARQTGKTFLIRECLKEQKTDYVEFNFIERPEIPKMFMELEDMGAKEVLTRLSVMSERTLIKGQTIIFFDEIQEYKEIATLIKFLVDEGSFRYILSGSLLGVELKGIRSTPVGYMRTIDMFPMDLEEFYIALGLSDDAFEMLRSSFNKGTPVTEAVHKRLMNSFRNYMVVGGMPAAVQSFVDNSDLNKVMEIHNTIVPGYINDFSKYETEDRKLRLRKIYDLIPAELAAKNKRYVFNDLDKNFRPEVYDASFQWLVNAGVAVPVYNVTEPRIPLLLNEKANLFKLFMSDVGLLSSRYGKATVLSFLNGNNNINYGAMYENYVAQELNAHGFKGYYFNSKKQGEVDFIIEYNLKAVPIEVKSGKDYQIHSALNTIISNKEYGIEKAIVLCNDNVKQDGLITYLPIYMSMFISNDDVKLPSSEKQSLKDI
ncbi:MAG: ATP-binding protein [Spirochaetales bacterium]|nr:ATP-binding protein [Spirochaetales bacterium]